ncbi:hypothetical protein BOS5A_210628 [Bosea sp. EC-HK365B]|nr:hypothetical protein BOSE7B_120489 [Bosea sp. 7B]VVT59837.1 hypothetical protein BOS5A_210628 [Bosea sp. EC-HK365B]VXC06856.1 hypothetical protein BOSE127_170129 [Bosea sp. 127]
MGVKGAWSTKPRRSGRRCPLGRAIDDFAAWQIEEVRKLGVRKMIIRDVVAEMSLSGETCRRLRHRRQKADRLSDLRSNKANWLDEIGIIGDDRSYIEAVVICI